jgi:hypothetical protein
MMDNPTYNSGNSSASAPAHKQMFVSRELELLMVSTSQWACLLHFILIHMASLIPGGMWG